DSAPLVFHRLSFEAAGIIHERVDTGPLIFHTGCVGTLGDFDKGCDQILMLGEEGAVDDETVAVGIDPVVAPTQETQVIAELAQLDIVAIVEITDDIDRKSTRLNS